MDSVPWTFLLNIASIRSLAKPKVFTRAVWGIVSRNQAGLLEEPWTVRDLGLSLGSVSTWSQDGGRVSYPELPLTHW